MWIEPMIESDCRKIIRFEKSELLCELDQIPTTEKGEICTWTEPVVGKYLQFERGGLN